MDLQTRKLELIQHILLLQDERLLSFIEKISKSNLDKKETNTKMVWTDYDKRMLEESFKDAEAGNLIPHAEVMAEFRKQYSR